ncbi:putative site-specific integrase-resolvase [Saccharopolyspora lacisalsi]|uniref:Putative site-specific integrase-resolvase n=1 Tax=Halosaccharopolyspora lacisalsi TaxID=1000566 RepID=A0A839DUZ0_9PSEU|nr:IS607 family transposase [Halosaccharopolyspora lacisalsi]MBA8824579.1 putative site-specific integrase-resolvase [Halosaccharopolyspora lacisalsi]
MDKVYRIGEFAARVGRSASTVRRWEREGLLTAKRTRSGQRYFTEADVRSVLNLAAVQQRATVVYCRVSSSGQRDELESQVAAMDQFCLANGITVDERVREVGGGMNLQRPKFLNLMDRIEDGQIDHVLVAHQDRLARFGFDYLEHVAHRNGCRITVANAESLSPQRELVEDLLAIVHTFSGRLDGLRRYEKQLTDEFGAGS